LSTPSSDFKIRKVVSFILFSILVSKVASLNLNLKKSVLKNGLQVIVVEDHSTPLVSVQVWYKTGSVNERTGKTGLSHLLEHMMFKGTKEIGSEEFSLIVQRNGGYDNAYTSEDETVYWSVLPSTKLELILRLEADRMQNAVFREFNEEKEVVKEERRLGENSPWGVLFETLKALAFISHPYRNPVIGWMSDIESITEDDLRNYYKNYYAPNNAILIISGDVESEKAIELAEKYFGKIEKRDIHTHNITEEPPQKGERRALIRKESYVTLFLLGYHIPSMKDEEFPAVYLLSRVLGDGKGSRLYRKIVYEMRLASSISSWVDWNSYPGLLYIYATLSAGRKKEELEKAVLEEIEKIRKEGIDEEEIERARNRALSSMLMNFQSVADKGMTVGTFARRGILEKLENWLQIISGVRREEVEKAAKKYLTEQNRTIVILEPEKKGEKK